MRDEVPMGLVGDPGAERHLAQRAISVHVEDPQADGVDENIEDSAGLSALVMFKATIGLCWVRVSIPPCRTSSSAPSTSSLMRDGP